MSSSFNYADIAQGMEQYFLCVICLSYKLWRKKM